MNESNASEEAPYNSTPADDAGDANGSTLEYAKVSGPAWLTVAADGSLTGVPTNADVGLNVFLVSVTDNIAPAVEATLNIAVINTNDAPAFTPDPIAGADATEDAVYNGSLAGSASDDDAGASLTYAKVSGPAWLSVALDGTLSGTPANADSWPNAFTGSVTDNALSEPARSSVPIKAPTAPRGLWLIAAPTPPSPPIATSAWPWAAATTPPSTPRNSAM